MTDEVRAQEALKEWRYQTACVLESRLTKAGDDLASIIEALAVSGTEPKCEYCGQRIKRDPKDGVWYHDDLTGTTFCGEHDIIHPAPLEPKALDLADELMRRISAACSAAEAFASAARGCRDGPPARISTAFIRSIMHDVVALRVKTTEEKANA